ncbi:nuclear transport factor 2 family protein [Mycolicibacterium grossiae]|uniref:Polyketide cyclase n=1 Tax=Mycolicibacterium grossiae TaxID=1552759 RepID=A0A1E8Q7W9_9MYCO|nr:nuclear transport factor 2 family protein [Mycolicibacterium grossiae]OFJ53994.1 polyketide cyclase [Mycolicibacterium grossiae]QEM44122.1 nuclear transport factor 2 family protein [Mycolicibacterium grossiae]
MTSSVIDRWHAFIDGGHDPDVLIDLLAEDAVFYSPAIFSPQKGREKTAMYLRAAAKLFGDTDFHYEKQWIGERSAVLEFAATVDGTYVNGVDMIQWNDDDEIIEFKVMLRPFKGLQLVMGKMAELLAPS